MADGTRTGGEGMTTQAVTSPTYAADLELGLETPLSSSSSIMGEDLPMASASEWGPSHPCFPHRNPYVAKDSPLYEKTRIIRVRRDFLLTGDLAPTFANLYPELLDPAGVSEDEFRRVIQWINDYLVETYNPYTARNIIDGVVGVLTGWFWEDLGATNVKARLRALEEGIEEWNRRMEIQKGQTTANGIAGEEGRNLAPKIIPLRLSGYMSLDIQIADPEILEDDGVESQPPSGVPKVGAEVVQVQVDQAGRS